MFYVKYNRTLYMGMAAYPTTLRTKLYKSLKAAEKRAAKEHSAAVVDQNGQYVSYGEGGVEAFYAGL